MPYCEKLNHDPSVEDIVDLIREVKKRQGYNVEGKKLYDKNHSWENFNQMINKLL